MSQEELKQRLIELLLEAPKTDVIYGNIKLKEPIQTAQTIAAHLIANGVTIRERGEWKEVYQNKQATVYECSKCHHLSFGTSDYCVCGADMRGVKDASFE